MAKFEIMIRNLENEEKNRTIECDECLVIGITDENEKIDGETMMCSSVDHMSTVMANTGMLRAAARMTIAKWDGLQDVKREKMSEIFNNPEMIGKAMAMAVPVTDL